MAAPSRKRQIFFLGSNIAVLGLAFLINVALTHWMVPEAFGKYKYTTNLILVAPTLLGLGINFSVARLVSRLEDSESRAVVAAGVVASTVWGLTVSLIIGGGLWILSLMRHPWAITATESMSQIWLIVPFVAIFMVQATVNSAYQGLGKVLSLAAFNAVPYLVILVGSLAWVSLRGQPLPFAVAAYLFLFGAVVVIVPRVLHVGAGFKGLRSGLIALRRDVREVGRYVYFSAILTSAITMTIGLILGGMFGFEEYGQYSLAVSLAMMFTLVASSLAIAQFRKNANQTSISRGDLLLTLGLTAGLMVVFLLVIDTVFYWIYPHTFGRSLIYLKILAFAYAIFGLSEYFNRFLMAKGLARNIFRIALFSGVFNIGLSSALGAAFGLLGLSVATTLVAAFNLSLYLLSYRGYLRRLAFTPKDE